MEFSVKKDDLQFELALCVLSAADRDVFEQAVDQRVVSGNRAQLRRQAPLHRDALDQEDRKDAQGRSRFQQTDQQLY